MGRNYETVLGAFSLAIRKSAVELSAHDAAHAEIEVQAHRVMQADPWLTPQQARAQIIKSSRGSALLGLASGPLGHLRLGDALARLEGQHPDALAAMANAISGPNGRTSSISKSIRRNSSPMSTTESYSQFKRRVAAELNGEDDL